MFSVAFLAYNMLAVLQRAVIVEHNLVEEGDIEMSPYYLVV